MVWWQVVFIKKKTPILFQIKFKIKVCHWHNRRSLTFSISDHLSSTSLAKLKYFGISCLPCLIGSYWEYTSEESSLGCPWKVLLGGFRVHQSFKLCNLNSNFMAKDYVSRCCRLYDKIAELLPWILQQQTKKNQTNKIKKINIEITQR